MAFCNAATVENLKSESSSSFWNSCISAWLCSWDGLVELLQSRALLWGTSLSLPHLLGQMELGMSWTCPELVVFFTAVASSTTSAVFLLLAELVVCVSGVKSAYLAMVCTILCKLESLESKMLGMSFLSFSEIVRKKTLLKRRPNLNFRLQLRSAALQVFLWSCTAEDFQPCRALQQVRQRALRPLLQESHSRGSLICAGIPQRSSKVTACECLLDFIW